MENLEFLDKECSVLGGLFQQVVNDMKNGLPHYDDFVAKASKLHSSLKSSIFSLASFLDAFQKIADGATNTKGATKEIGACLTRIVIRHKAIESRLKTLCSALLDCLILPLGDKIEEWKKSVSCLDKEHAKEYKKLRSEYKKKTENYFRLSKKNKKNKIEAQKAIDGSYTELSKHIKFLEETEKNAVRRVLIEERSRYCTFVACLKPFIDEEVFMVSDFQQLEEITKKLTNHTEDPFKLPPASEQVLADIIKKAENYTFTTPPSSPSSLGSRKSSMCSISSVGSSAGSPHHISNVRLRSLSQLPAEVVEQVKSVVQNPSLGPMRLSSISSQDSGFTSQDTLFLRPHSPRSNKNAVSGSHWAPSDRPHTISSAYEKGTHNRPSLQPYTFASPVELNEVDDEGNTIVERRSHLRKNGDKPPIPLRNFDKPSVPEFNVENPDMVLPHPIYMNMNDVKKGGCLEDDCKTPLVEQMICLPESGKGLDDGGSPSGSSSSGYGSQNNHRNNNNNNNDQGGGGGRHEFLYERLSCSFRPQLFSSSAIIPEDNEAIIGGQKDETLRRIIVPCHRDTSSPPLPGPPPPLEESEGTSSSRGSLENFPPPPPHLLVSSSDDEDKSSFIMTQRSRSVAESVRALQNIATQRSLSGNSPKTLRRTHSLSTGGGNSSSNGGGGGGGNGGGGSRLLTSGEVIYAPVTHLQAKTLLSLKSSEGEHYGFGRAFTSVQNQYYNDSHRSSYSVANSSEYQTASRVRRWIESKSVSDVDHVRPFLNAEIKQGFTLRKTNPTNDRSAPNL